MLMIDIILLVIIGGFAMFGFWFGFVHTLGSMVGTLVAVYLASRYYEPLADWLISITGWGDNAANVLMFIVAFVIIARLVGIVFWFIDKFLSIVTKLPLISTFNRVFGIALGLFEGMLTIGIVIYFIERFPLTDGIMQSIAQSEIAPYTTKVASLLLPLVPEGIKLLESSVDYVENIVL